MIFALQVFRPYRRHRSKQSSVLAENPGSAASRKQQAAHKRVPAPHGNHRRWPFYFPLLVPTHQCDQTDTGNGDPEPTGTITNHERSSVSIAALVAIAHPIFPICVHKIGENRRDQQINCVSHGKPLRTRLEHATRGLDAFTVSRIQQKKRVRGHRSASMPSSGFRPAPAVSPSLPAGASCSRCARGWSVPRGRNLRVVRLWLPDD